MPAGSTAIVIKGGCTSKQAKFRILKMDVSQDQLWWQIDKQLRIL
jgi:hypothetical protein